MNSRLMSSAELDTFKEMESCWALGNKQTKSKLFVLD